MFSDILFLLSAGLAVAGSLLVVLSRDIMHACIYLLGALLGVAGLYVTLGADFVAATQVMVYVGGVVILMVFAVILTGGKNLLQFARSGDSKRPLMGNYKTFVFGGITAIVFLLSTGKILLGVINHFQDDRKTLPYGSTVEEIGTLFLTDHVLAFEMSSVLLLGALIGAAIIARPKKQG